MDAEISQDQILLFNGIDMFISCLYTLSDVEMTSYYTFCVYANNISNPNRVRDVKRVIENFHSYFYINNNIKHMSTINFDGMSNQYGDSNLPIRKITESLNYWHEVDCMRKIAIYVFDSYMHKKEALGLFTYEASKNKNLEMYYDMNAV